MRTVARFCVSSIHLRARLKERSFFLDVVSEEHSILARSVFVLHGHRLCRDVAFVLIASIAIWIPDILLYFYRETGNWRFTGSEIRGVPCHWQRSNGSASFTMSSGGQDGYSFIPRWNDEAATPESSDQRVKLFVSSAKKEEEGLVWFSTSRHV